MDYMVVEQTKEYKKRIAYDPKTNTFSETEHDCIFLHRGFIYPYGWLKGYGTPPAEHLDVFYYHKKNVLLVTSCRLRLSGFSKEMIATTN